MLLDTRAYAAATPTDDPTLRGALGAACAAIIAAGLVGAVVVGPAGATTRARAGATGPGVATRAGAGLPQGASTCPAGVLEWVVTSVAYRADPLNGRDLTITISGTVRNDTGAAVSVVMADDSIQAPPEPGQTTYPVYLSLADGDLYPGDTSTFTGSSAEIGVTAAGVVRQPLTYSTTWDSPQYSDRCGPPPEAGG